MYMHIEVLKLCGECQPTFYIFNRNIMYGIYVEIISLVQVVEKLISLVQAAMVTRCLYTFRYKKLGTSDNVTNLNQNATSKTPPPYS